MFYFMRRRANLAKKSAVWNLVLTRSMHHFSARGRYSSPSMRGAERPSVRSMISAMNASAFFVSTRQLNFMFSRNSIFLTVEFLRKRMKIQPFFAVNRIVSNSISAQGVIVTLPAAESASAADRLYARTSPPLPRRIPPK